VTPAFIAIGVTVLVVAIGVVVVALTDGGPRHGSERRPLPVPASWLALGAILVVLGVLVLPRRFGLVFLFLPMIWSRRARRPRGPGHPAGGSGSIPEPDHDPYDEDR